MITFSILLKRVLTFVSYSKLTCKKLRKQFSGNIKAMRHTCFFFDSNLIILVTLVSQPIEVRLLGLDTVTVTKCYFLTVFFYEVYNCIFTFKNNIKS